MKQELIDVALGKVVPTPICEHILYLAYYVVFAGPLDERHFYDLKNPERCWRGMGRHA